MKLNKRKFNLYLPLLLFGALSLCLAVDSPRLYDNVMEPNAYTASTVFLSSNTSSSNTCVGCEVIISSVPTLLHTVTINTPGTSSTLTIFDAYNSTTAAGIKKIATIDTTSKISLLYDVFTTSTGLTISNSGSPAADITLSVRPR